MFTGIVEEIGIIKNINNGIKTSRIKIKANKVLKNTKIGDSISTNGVCLTAVNLGDDFFEADIMAESIKRTSFSYLKIGNFVNLERAMQANSRFGGHIVSGHIDGIGKITNMIKEDNAVWIYINTKAEIQKLIVEKGSIAIDGISLTVAKVFETEFAVCVIPHTSKQTSLLKNKVGDFVNLENDIIGKYVERLLNFREKRSNISLDFLSQNGFL